MTDPATHAEMRDNGTESARRANVDSMIEELAVEAAVDNAIRQRALNNGRVLLTAEDAAMRRFLIKTLQAPPAPDIRSEVARLVTLETALERVGR